MCYSSNFAIDSCTAGERNLIIPLLQTVPADEQIKLTVEGISNPNYGTTNFIDVAILDSQNNVIQFINDAFSIDSIQGAKYSKLSSV